MDLIEHKEIGHFWALGFRQGWNLAFLTHKTANDACTGQGCSRFHMSSPTLSPATAQSPPQSTDFSVSGGFVSLVYSTDLLFCREFILKYLICESEWTFTRALTAQHHAMGYFLKQPSKKKNLTSECRKFSLFSLQFLQSESFKGAAKGNKWIKITAFHCSSCNWNKMRSDTENIQTPSRATPAAPRALSVI